MGNVVGCFVPATHDRDQVPAPFAISALDEGLGHSFCYVRPSSEALNLSPSHSDRYASELHSASFRSHKTASDSVAFRTISGASVSANTSTPHTILSHEQLHSFANVPDDRHAAFESSGSFVSIPLQPVPRGVTFSGPISATFSGPMSAPFERVFRSGPLELSHMSGPIDLDHTHFSAPLAGSYHSKRLQQRQNLSRLINAVGKPVKGALSKTISSTLARTHRSLVVPVREFVWRHVRNGRKEAAIIYDSGSEPRYVSSEADPIDNRNLQWAQGKAGEDRVHVVVSEDHGWLFVGIYDGFNGPDAPDFLMRNLYTAVYRELEGLLWDAKGVIEQGKCSNNHDENNCHVIEKLENGGSNTHLVKDVSSKDTKFCSNRGNLTRSRTLKDYLESSDSDVEDSTSSSGVKHEGRSLSMLCMSREVLFCSRNHENGEQSQAVNFTNERANDSAVDAEDGPGNEEVKFKDSMAGSTTHHHVIEANPSTLMGTSLPLPSLGHKQMKRKESHRKFLPEREDLCDVIDLGMANCAKDGDNLRDQGAVDHYNNVLMALSRALQETEEAYLNMADLALEENPELLLMGSCILVALVKDKDVYILNVGDSRAIVAQELDKECSLSNTVVTKVNGLIEAAVQNDLECISEESEFLKLSTESSAPSSSASLFALQLSQDHSTSIEEEVQRIKLEHPDDNTCIFNDRVKGTLKVTRAFGAGFLKKPRWNNAVLKMFQIDYVGSDPYVTCAPALCHHRLGPNDRFLVLSSDGMDFHELLDIPQGDRRKYHDDVSVMVISLEGKVWKSSS
ncbi:hypothetical protein L7F22_015506 [Adiantum nelumboides]|nr:hypothetical protein [Adiantum nelumboides]